MSMIPRVQILSLSIVTIEFVKKKTNSLHSKSKLSLVFWTKGNTFFTLIYLNDILIASKYSQAINSVKGLPRLPIICSLFFFLFSFFPNYMLLKYFLIVVILGANKWNSPWNKISHLPNNMVNYTAIFDFRQAIFGLPNPKTKLIHEPT